MKTIYSAGKREDLRLASWAKMKGVRHQWVNSLHPLALADNGQEVGEDYTFFGPMNSTSIMVVGEISKEELDDLDDHLFGDQWAEKAKIEAEDELAEIEA